MRAYADGMDNGADILEFRDSWWDSNIHELAEALRKTGVRGFVITEESTALMRDLWSLQEEGCSIGGLKMARHENGTERKGILVHVN